MRSHRWDIQGVFTLLCGWVPLKVQLQVVAVPSAPVLFLGRENITGSPVADFVKYLTA